jgi:hypothetical protein
VEEGENTREIVQRVHEDNSVLEVGLGRGIYIVARSMARKLCCYCSSAVVRGRRCGHAYRAFPH